MCRKMFSRGMVLITTMLFVVIIVMLVAILITSASNSLKYGGAYSDNEQACMAALSGLEYARFAIYQDSAWMQGFNDSEVVTFSSHKGGSDFSALDIDKIKIIESKGQVRGIIGENNKARRGRANFFIRFVTPGGSKASENFKDIYGNKYTINSLSCNNIGGAGTVDIPGSVKSVPPGKIFIVSEGICNGSRRRVEALMEVSVFGGLDSSILAKKNVNVTLRGSNSMFWLDSLRGKSVARTLANLECSAPRPNCILMEGGGRPLCQEIGNK